MEGDDEGHLACTAFLLSQPQPQFPPHTVNAHDAQGYTALHVAVMQSQERQVQLLLEGGDGTMPVDVNAVTTSPAAAAAAAAAAGAGARSNQQSALHIAARTGHLGIAMLLVQGGADKNNKDGEGRCCAGIRVVICAVICAVL